MAATAAPHTVYGVTLTLGGAFAFKVKGFSFDDINRPHADVTTIDATVPAAASATTFGGRIFHPGSVSDPGRVTVRVLWDHNAALSMNAAKGTALFTWKGTGGAEGTWTGDASWERIGPVEASTDEGDEFFMGTIILKLSGVWTRTAGA